MANNLIQIKRSSITAVPPSLANGELAYTSNGHVLFIGIDNSIEPIGGKRTPGILTANQAIVTNSSSYVDGLKTITLEVNGTAINTIATFANSTTLGSSANNEVPTTHAVKTYVDGKNFSSLTDVNITNPTDGQLLVYNGAQWVNKATGNGISVNTQVLSITAGDGIAVNTSGVHVKTGMGVSIDGNGNIAIGQNVSTTSDVTFRNIVASGNLTVQGTLTTIDTVNIVIEDPMIKLARSQADSAVFTDTADIGFYGAYGNTSQPRYTGLARDPVSNTFVLFVEKTIEPDNTNIDGSEQKAVLQAWLNTGALIANGSTVAITANSTVNVNFVANTLSLSTALPSTSGGTGFGSYTLGDILVGNTTSGLSKLAVGTAGKVLQSNGTTLVYADLDGGTF